MDELTIPERQAAFLRVRDLARPFRPLGCLGLLVDAWPGAFRGLAAGAVIELWRTDGLTAVLDLAFGAPACWPNPADPVLVEFHGDLVAGLFTEGGALVRSSDGLNWRDAPVRRAWRARPRHG